MPITVSGTSIVFNDSTTQTTAFTSAVTSLNGQTGAITNTSANSIGSYFAGASSSYLSTNADVAIGTTQAGSTLRQLPSVAFSGFAQNAGLSNPGFSGTWRAMTRSGYENTGCGFWGANPALWVRVS
jgi:hypothetical protein